MTYDDWVETVIALQKKGINDLVDGLLLYEEQMDKTQRISRQQLQWAWEEGWRLVDQWYATWKENQIDLKQLINHNLDTSRQLF